MKIYFEVKEVLDFNVPLNFQPIRTCLGISFENLKNSLPLLHLDTVRNSLLKITNFCQVAITFGAEPTK